MCVVLPAPVEPDGLMGASNAIAAYTVYAGKVPATAMQVLVYMALVSRDADAQPWYSQGHRALAEHALGRAEPDEADVRAVGRAMTALLRAGAVSVVRRGAVRVDGPSTAKYRLHLHTPDTGRKPSDVDAVENPAQDPSHRTENGGDTGRFSAAHRTESGAHTGRKPSTRGTTRNQEELQEEEVVDLPTDLTVSRARCDHGLPATIRCPACSRGLGTKERHLRAV